MIAIKSSRCILLKTSPLAKLRQFTEEWKKKNPEYDSYDYMDSTKSRYGDSSKISDLWRNMSDMDRNFYQKLADSQRGKDGKYLKLNLYKQENKINI